MDDQNLFLVLRSTNEYTRWIFQDYYNRDWYISPPDTCSECTDDCSRATTPIDCEIPSAALGLALSKKPKHVGRGYTFGRYARCDVYLGRSSISGVHFSVTFDRQGRILLKDSSRNGTIVSYQNMESLEPRRNFTWILFPDLQPIKVTIGDLRRDQVEFTIEIPFQHNFFDIAGFLQENADIDPPLDSLDIVSQNTTTGPSESVSPRNRPQYLMKNILGQGTFGQVRLAVDVSTGRRYASKKFIKGDWTREVEALKQLSHDHIVRFVDLLAQDSPEMVMEYYELGNLIDQHSFASITDEECAAILVQGTDALAYLHEKKLAHRDIKPSNILVESRRPFRLRISDFGFAKNTSQLNSWVGTLEYWAPEVHNGNPYTAAVDVWSLGVVVYEYAYGLPECHGKRRYSHWFSLLLKEVEDKDSDCLIDFLKKHMIQRNPQMRTPANVCHQISLELFRGDVYPNPLPCSPAASRGTEGPSTLADRLWGPPSNSETRLNDELQIFKQHNAQPVPSEQPIGGTTARKPANDVYGPSMETGSTIIDRLVYEIW
ncbi:MAG: hypothetical protein LQ343_007357 [Gyalolechia ehrenbergii]|nr:MAG: hypothetical protein LQ343_007357 [Gyalolechia ehrenbergii]